MAAPNPISPTARQGRVGVAGKHLVLDGGRWFLNAVSYGPFGTEETKERLSADFAAIRSMGFNAVRVYELPSELVLAAATEHELRLIVGIPWTDHVDFLRDEKLCKEIRATVRKAAAALASRAEVGALLVGNEIEKTLVRWMGPEQVKAFVEGLIDIAREAAPHCLVSYATYPSTEYLVPSNADFLAINLYLEERATFAKYALRLQNLAGAKPLVITEFGLDVKQHGEDRQLEVMRWQRQELLRLGVAGNVWFSFTDEWHRGGEEVTKWNFGLVDRQRVPRLAARSASGLPSAMEGASGPRISVVVCTRNGSATLRECLEALGRQRYANREIIVVDDGSTDAVPAIAQSFEFVRYVRQHHAGLSVARNLGAAHANGEIIAFTDDDCAPDAEWLVHLACAFDDPKWVAAGGPNLPPAPRNNIEAAVAQAPGGPSHVLINDEEAEHLPGCNLAIRKSALDAICGFQPQFVAAGDDVDVCWRLREMGGRLRFVPGAFVWHHRRFTVAAYLRQQRGYGYAEALLMKEHPQRFGPLGGARWRGLIYGEPNTALLPSEGSVFHGPQGTGLFQVIYAQGSGFAWWDWLGGVLWVALAIALSVCRLPLLSALLGVIAGVMAWRRMRTSTLKALRDRLLLWALCLSQPVVREWARLRGMIQLGARPSFRPTLPDILPPKKPMKRTRRLEELTFWSEEGVDRSAWLRELRALLVERQLPYREDDGWRWFDIEVGVTKSGQMKSTGAFTSVTEYHGDRRMLTRVALCVRHPRLPLLGSTSVSSLRELALEAAKRAGLRPA